MEQQSKIEELVSEFYIPHPTTITLSGPSNSGKTMFLFELLKSELIKPRPSIIFYFYSVNQPLYEKMKKHFGNRIVFHRGLPTNGFEIFLEEAGVISPQISKIICLDDLYGDAIENKSVKNLFYKGSHHLGITVAFITHNIFAKGKQTRCLNLNSQFLILFKNPRDKLMIHCLSRQMYPDNSKVLLNAYDDACKRPYGYLFINLLNSTDERVRLMTNILESDPENMQKEHTISFRKPFTFTLDNMTWDCFHELGVNTAAVCFDNPRSIVLISRKIREDRGLDHAVSFVYESFPLNDNDLDTLEWCESSIKEQYGTNSCNPVSPTNYMKILQVTTIKNGDEASIRIDRGLTPNFVDKITGDWLKASSVDCIFLTLAEFEKVMELYKKMKCTGIESEPWSLAWTNPGEPHGAFLFHTNREKSMPWVYKKVESSQGLDGSGHQEVLVRSPVPVEKGKKSGTEIGPVTEEIQNEDHGAKLVPVTEEVNKNEEEDGAKLAPATE